MPGNPLDDRSLAYSTYLGGGSRDMGAAIAVDRAGRDYITGWTLRLR